jgi:hypothetical protein
MNAKFVGITWREARTGRVQTQKALNLRTVARLVSTRQGRVTNGLLLTRIVAVCALITAAIFVFCMWLDGWHFIWHTPRFWQQLGAVLFQG